MLRKSKSLRIGGFIALVLVVIIFVFVGIWESKEPPPLRNLHKITIAQAGDFFLYAPLYVAIDAGCFTEEGLDVTLVTTGGDEKTWAAIISENAEFGIADPTFVAVSDARGIPGKVIGSIVNGVPFWGITIQDKIAPFQSTSDLNSYSIGTFPSPSTAYTLQKKMFIDAGIEPNIREGAFGTLIAMLKSGTVDIALELEPNVSQMVKEGGKVVYSLAEVYGDFAITGLTASPNYISENPIVTQKVVNGLQKALRLLHEDRARSLAILGKRFPEIDNNVAKSALERVLSENIIPKALVIKKNAWEKAIQLRVDVGDIVSPKTYSTYVDTTFAFNAQNNDN